MPQISHNWYFIILLWVNSGPNSICRWTLRLTLIAAMLFSRLLTLGKWLNLSINWNLHFFLFEIHNTSIIRYCVDSELNQIKYSMRACLSTMRINNRKIFIFNSHYTFHHRSYIYICMYILYNLSLLSPNNLSRFKFSCFFLTMSSVLSLMTGHPCQDKHPERPIIAQRLVHIFYMPWDQVKF